MAGDRDQILRWAEHVISGKGSAPHQVLRVAATASLADIQTAFHTLARNAHPDLYRAVLSADELERVTTAYAHAAAAYQELRLAHARGPATKPSKAADRPTDKAGNKAEKKPDKPAEKPVAEMTTAERFADRARKMTPERGSQPIPTVDAPPPPQAPTANTKAMTYFRKAERALRQGDLRSAVLQLKLAIAADPQSAMLRQALSEVESEIKAK